MEEIEKYLQVINEIILSVLLKLVVMIVLIIFFTSCLMIGIKIGKWLYKLFKKYCL
jgi:hypothetical protein